MNNTSTKKHQNLLINDYSSPKNDKSDPYLIRPIIRENRGNGDTKIRPNHTGHNLLSQRIEKNEIEPTRYSRSIDEKIDTKQANISAFRSLTQCTMDSVAYKNVTSGRNKNKVLRISRNVRFNQRVSCRSENIEEPSRQHVQYSMQNEHPRVPVSCVSETDENMNNLQGLKGCYKDIVILNSENDTETANNFRQQLLNLGIPELTVDIFEDINPGMSEMRSLSLLHEQYRTVLLLITNSFAKDNLRRHQAEVLLRKSLETEALDQWVVPVWIDRDSVKSIEEWAPIKGIKYHPLHDKERNLLQQVTDLVDRVRG